ncbi:carbohydrate ABC transporter permease [Treponema primitia]|uniref:carbohydrate ABC transporter permease n=1 Tax=Treponema primitia TaxID=88058 RepID=UPI000474C74C|nr:carbohydrate ABC transporter permease [Treponema primitia]
MKKKYSVSSDRSPPWARRLIYILLTLISIACLFPILLVFAISISDEATITKYGYEIVPRVLSLRSYEYLLSDFRQIMRGYAVSIAITLIGTVMGTLITAMIAYPLSRKDFHFRKFFTLFVVFTMLFNGGLVPWYLVYVKMLGVKNTIIPLIMPLLLNGFNVIILRTFISANIHPAVIESAIMDGAGELQIFFKIVLPLSVTGLAAIALLISLNFWNDWYNALLFIDTKKLYPLQFLMYRVNISIQVLNTSSFIPDAASAAQVRLPNETARMAMGILGIGPIILAYPFLQKYFVRGLTLGSVKG